MPRVTRKEADQHREDVIEAAARLFRERGIAGVSVPGVMAEAGLTHGAFYGQFESKEALAAAACERAFEQIHALYDQIEQRHGGDRNAARAEFIKNYTARIHRDRPGLGCAAAAMGGEIAHEQPGSPVRSAFAAGLEAMLERFKTLLARPRRKPPTRDETLAVAAMLVGALVLSRATKGHKISDEVLLAVRKTLTQA